MICETKKPDCQNEATFRHFWPGKEPMHVCANCMIAINRIANALDLYLHSEVIKRDEERV